MYLPTIISKISQDLISQKIKLILVGGCVRDHFMGLKSKDYDIEVYGVDSLEELEKILKKYTKVNIVGKFFGVLKFNYDKQEYDFSLPRKESKISSGHRGFEVVFDKKMDFRHASKRRDFTINAIGYDILEQKFLDPHNGIADIEKKILKHIDDKTFVEDPLRVYRAVQFCARFEFDLDISTFDLCKKMVQQNMLEELSKERIYEEFKKLLLKSTKPSIGFHFMRELDILKHFPQLKSIINVPQNPKYHPEGDVWTHTMLCIDRFCESRGTNQIFDTQNIDEKQILKYIFAILCHDLGKATHTTIDTDGCIRCIGHEKAGVTSTREFLYKLTDEHDFINTILPLVEYHLRPSQFYRDNAKDKAFKKLATRVNLTELEIVARADFLGRTTYESLLGEYKAGDWFVKKIKELNVEIAPLPNLLQGKDLISLGFTPSSQFKEILDMVYEAQLNGDIANKDEAINFVKNNFIKSL